MLGKLVKAAAKAFGISDWVEDFEPQAPTIDSETIVVTHAYRNSGSMDFASDDDRGGYDRIEWLELRRNDSAAPSMTSAKPAFAFFGDYQLTGMDGKKFPMGMMNTVRAPGGLEPDKYTLFRREVALKDPTLAYWLFKDAAHDDMAYKAEIVKANVSLDQALAAMKTFEDEHAKMRIVDTVNPGNRHYAAPSMPAPQPMPVPA